MACKVLEPGILGGTVPMLCALRDIYDVACMKSDGRFAPFLIDAFPTHTYEYLMCSVMDVPVVAAARFKSYVGITLYGGPHLTSPRGGI